MCVCWCHSYSPLGGRFLCSSKVTWGLSKASGGFQRNGGTELFLPAVVVLRRRWLTSGRLSRRGAGFLSLTCAGWPWEWGEADLRKVDGSQDMCDTMEEVTA